MHISPHLLTLSWVLSCFEKWAIEMHNARTAFWAYCFSLSALLAIFHEGKPELQDVPGKNTSANIPKYYPATLRLQPSPWIRTQSHRAGVLPSRPHSVEVKLHPRLPYLIGCLMFSWSLLTQSSVPSELVQSLAVPLTTPPVPSFPSPYPALSAAGLACTGPPFLRKTLWL